MQSHPSRWAHLCALLPALAALALVNVDWTRLGHTHAGAHGIFHHHHGHFGEHHHPGSDRPHSHPHDPDVHGSGEDSNAPDRSDRPEAPDAPTALYLASTLTLDREAGMSRSFGCPTWHITGMVGTVALDPAPRPCFDPAVPRGPPQAFRSLHG